MREKKNTATLETGELELLVGIAETLRQRRTAAGRTLADVSTAAGVSVSLVSQVERGQCVPSIGTLWRLCGALGLTLRDLPWHLGQ